MILICCSVMACEIELFFMHSLAFCVSYEKCLLGSFAHFQMRLFVFLLLRYLSFLHIVTTSSFSDACCANASSCSVGCLLPLSMLLYGAEPLGFVEFPYPSFVMVHAFEGHL